MDKGMLSIIPVGRGWLVKCSQLLNHMVNLDKMMHTYSFQYGPATGMQNGEYLHLHFNDYCMDIRANERNVCPLKTPLSVKPSGAPDWERSGSVVE